MLFTVVSERVILNILCSLLIQNLSSPKSNDSTSVDQENWPPHSNEDGALISSLSPNQQERRQKQAAATVGRKRASVSVNGTSAEDDGGGQPLSKRVRGSSGSSTSTPVGDNELDTVGDAWLKAIG